jgi:hypothetical protein
MIDTSYHLEKIKYALAEHKSQIEKINGSDNWATLNEISNGDFVNFLTNKFEFFRRSRII